MDVLEELVLDGSVALAWGFEDEDAPYAAAVLDRLPGIRAYVPTVWPLEVGNGLLVAERRQRITQADALEFIDTLQAFPITVDAGTTERALREILSLARDQNLTVYDAAYLELAMRRGLPLATLDGRLRDAADAVGVPIYEAA